MALFYLIRHGEPTYDHMLENGFWGFGRDFAPLTEKGKQQAEMTAKDIRLKDAEIIVSSPYTRALQTAQIISRETGIPVEVEIALHEWIPDQENLYRTSEESFASAREFTKFHGEYPSGEKCKWESLSHMRKRVREDMVPEFSIPDDVEDEGIFEEGLLWDNVLLQLKFFYDKGLRNIIALDFDDIRTRELPYIFKGFELITLKLVSSDTEQTKKQMEHRKNNEGGLYIPDYVERANSVIMNRKLLPNEVQIDIAGKSKEQVLKEVINIIDNFKSEKNYDYELDDERNYLSWVQSRQLV